jgi:hypothetical protein
MLISSNDEKKRTDRDESCQLDIQRSLTRSISIAILIVIVLSLFNYLLQTDSINGNGKRDTLLNLSRQSSLSDLSSHRQTTLMPIIDESKLNDDGKQTIRSQLKYKQLSIAFLSVGCLDESDPNSSKRRKIDEVNETLVRLPLNIGYEKHRFRLTLS